MKRFIALLFGSILVFSYHAPTNGCLYYPHGEDYRFYILQPAISHRNELSTFYFTTEYFNYEYQLNDRAAEQNLKEWGAYFKNKYSKECLTTLIYSLDAFCVYNANCVADSLVQCPKLKKEFTQNSPATVYLKYMHKCLNFLYSSGDPWKENDFISDFDAYARLITEGEKLLETFANDDFLRKRVAYNLLRLYYYRGDKKCVHETYHFQFSPAVQKSMIDGSAYFYYSGYVSAGGAEYDYIMSRVFDVSVEKKKRSLELFSRQDINQTLKLAKTQHEKAVIWGMWLLQHPGHGLTTLNRIYKQDPNYEDFDILLSREINKLEDWLLAPKVLQVAPATDYLREDYKGNYDERDEYNHNRILLKNKYNDLAYTDSVIDFVKKLQSSGYKKRSLFNLYLVHLYMIKGNYDTATLYYNKLKNEPLIKKDAGYALQANIDGIVLHFAQAQHMDAKGQDLLHALHKKINANKTVQLKRIEKNLLQYVGALLAERGDIGWASLLINKAYDYDEFESEWDYENYFILGNYHNAEQYLAMNGSEKDFETVFNLLKKRKRTAFENFVVLDEHRTIWDTDTAYYHPFGFSKDRVMDYRARLKIRADSLYTALAYLKTIDNKHWNVYPHNDYNKNNPFTFADDYPANSKIGYNLKEVVQEIVHLKKLLTQNSTKKDSVYLLLGNVYYNMTAHGNYWIAQNFWRDNEEFPFEKKVKNPSPFVKQYYGCTRALYWYEKAIATTKNKDLLGTALLMANNCRNNYLVTTSTATQKNYDKNRLLYRKQLKQRLNINADEYNSLIGSCDNWERYFYTLNNNYKKTVY